MKLRTIAITAAALALIACALAPVALRAAPKAGAQQIAGTWRLDPKQSDMPRREGGGVGRPRPEGEQRGGGRRGLPRVLRITSGDLGYQLADSSGTIVQEITYAPVRTDELDEAPPKAQGTWKGSELVVTRTRPGGGSMTQTFELEKGGSVLVVKTRMERAHGEEIEMKRVYTRQGA